jgi:hypothetical protein
LPWLDLKQQPAFLSLRPHRARWLKPTQSTKQSFRYTNNHSDLFLHRNTVGQIDGFTTKLLA